MPHAQVPCPSCKTPITVNYKRLGGPGICPYCGEKFRVPTLSALQESGQIPTKKKNGDSKPNWQFQLLQAFLVLGLIAFLVYLSQISSNESFGYDGMSKVAGETFFRELSIPNAKNEAIWNLKDVEVFGQDTWLGNGAGYAVEERVESHPELFDVSIPCWCRGTDARGELVQQIRTLKLRYTCSKEVPEPRLENYEFTQIEPLPWSQQLQIWAFFSFLIPVLMLVTAIIAALFGHTAPGAFFTFLSFGIWKGAAGLVDADDVAGSVTDFHLPYKMLSGMNGVSTFMGCFLSFVYGFVCFGRSSGLIYTTVGILLCLTFAFIAQIFIFSLKRDW